MTGLGAGPATGPATGTATGPVLVLVHGAWAEGWVWDGVVPRLQSAGLDPVVVDLPGTPASGVGVEQAHLDGYVQAVLAALPAEGPVVLVGHSGGGVVVTAVAEAVPERVAGVVHVAGIMLPSGTAFAQVCAEAVADGVDLDGGVVPFLRRHGEDASVVPPEVAVAVFFQRAPAAAAVAAARRLVPQPDAGFEPRATWTAERAGRVPRLYVEALADRSIPLRLQRYLQARTPGASVVTLDSDHAPQLSAPDALARALVAFATNGPLSPCHA